MSTTIAVSHAFQRMQAVSSAEPNLVAAEAGEYVGITALDDQVWTSFTGTSLDEYNDDPASHPTVIWSSRILNFP